jgi:hypothetical protein
MICPIEIAHDLSALRVAMVRRARVGQNWNAAPLTRLPLRSCLASAIAKKEIENIWSRGVDIAAKDLLALIHHEMWYNCYTNAISLR